MKKYILSFLLLPIIGLSQFEEIKTFQKNIIKKDITGSNVALVYTKGEIIYKNTENSKKEGDRKYLQIQYFQFGQCQSQLLSLQ